ncbi:nuclear factor 7, ovary-like [Channa argus]|uniref:nuclear factor 7, ovary-like n=1 Tax=Channa argus TaxID=215402 RepID=UPI00294431E9|nr:hypothetical protein Q8A73_014401 [Channa argus]
MAAYSEDLTCSICLTIFTDPVILVCGHSFCRECITLALSSQHQCPQCRATVPTEGKCLLTNHILKSLAEKAKEADKLRRERGNDKDAAELCPEHEEKLKLFCITDQQLACIICRDAEKHEGHKFKPVKEAAASLRKELETFVQHVSNDIQAIEGKANAQKEEITKTKGKSEQISSQFEEMHQFLRQREEEIKKELKKKETEPVRKMNEVLNGIETALSESKELKEKVTSVLAISDSETFLKSWSEDKKMKAAKCSFKHRGGSLQVVNTSLSLGPYESHLQFFVWKEMIQVIQPRAELLSIQTNNTYITVSASQNEPVRCQNCQVFKGLKSYDRQTSSVTSSFSNDFSSGQHYWEVDVGKRTYWELGVRNNFLKYNGQSYVVCGQHTFKLQLNATPRKIGIYINCSSKELSFYDADTMKHINTCSNVPVPASAHFNIKYTPSDQNPMTVCWYWPRDDG